jgi:signal peptidase I
MDDVSGGVERPVRYAFRVVLVFAVLGLLMVLVSPVVGATWALVYGAVAWGIRRGSFWAAVMGACFAGIPIIAVLARLGEPAGNPPGVLALASGLLIQGILVVFLVLAAHSLAGRSSSPYGWVAGIVLIVAFWTCLRPFRMPTGSMENTLLAGDAILVETVGRAPSRGGMVVFYYPVNHKDVFVKRVVGMPGDRLRIANKQLYVNGLRVNEPYATHKTEYVDSYRDNFPSEPNIPLYPQGRQMLEKNVRNGEVVVPANQYFVLGDNRDSSLDSRYWGFVSRSELIGKPVLIYGSSEPGDTSNPQAPGILTTRWRRLLKPL